MILPGDELRLSRRTRVWWMNVGMAVVFRRPQNTTTLTTLGIGFLSDDDHSFEKRLLSTRWSWIIACIESSFARCLPYKRACCDWARRGVQALDPILGVLRHALRHRLSAGRCALWVWV